MSLTPNYTTIPLLNVEVPLSKVFHDATLFGDGTRISPLRVIGGGSLPDQSGHAGEFLTTDGSNASWTTNGAGDALTTNPLSQFAATTSAQLAGVISDETGTGALVFANTPTLVTPILGIAAATSINKVAITAPATSATLTIDDGFTLHVTGNVTALSGSHTGTSSGTNTGDQTSIVGITGTKAQFDTAVTDGNFAYQSDLSGYQPLDTQLTDLAGLSYTGNSLKVVRVNVGETGFELATVSGGGTPAGADTQVQYNSSGSFGASANLTYNGTTLALNASAETSTLAVKGAGATSSTKTLVLEDSAAVNILSVNDAGQFEVGKDWNISTNSTYTVLNAGSISSGNIVLGNTSGGTITPLVSYFGGELRFSGSNAFSNARGLDFRVLNDNTSTSNVIRAGAFSARNNSAGSRASTVNGLLIDAYTDNQSGGTVPTVAGLYFQYLGVNAIGPTVTNLYGIKVDDILNAGTITNTYGIHIGDLTVGAQTNTPYSIYASDANSHSYFAGKVGVGTATSPSTAIHAVVDTANTVTIQDVVTIGTNSTGTAGAGFGPGILFTGESDTTSNREMGRLATVWTTATDGAREAAFVWQLGDGAGALAEVLRLDRTATTGKLTLGSANQLVMTRSDFTTGVSFTLGNSAQRLTLSSSATADSIFITNSGISTSGTAGVIVGTTGYTSSTLSKTALRFTDTYTPTTGSGTFKFLELGGTINQSTGGTGATWGLYLNTTLTSPSDYHSIESVNGKIKFTDTQSAGSGSLAGSLLNLAQTWNTSGTPTAVKLNVTDTASNAASLLMDLQVGGTSKFKVSKAGFVTSPTLYSATTGRATGQTAANSSIATYTVGSADATFVVSANILVTTSSAEAFTVRVTYTDEGNTSRTIKLSFSASDGTLTSAIASANGATPYGGVPMHIRCKASTAITIDTAGVFTGCTYNAEGVIRQLA